MQIESIDTFGIGGTWDAPTDSRIILFENGTGCIRDNGDFVFSPGHNFKVDETTNILPFPYEDNAVCPKWQQFLNDVLPNQVEQDALMEFVGYCFSNSHRYQKFLYLIGSGANGKSVILNVLNNFFGQKFVSHVDVVNLHHHALAGVVNKMLNISLMDNPRCFKHDQLSSLKRMVSGDSFLINPKCQTPYILDSKFIPKFILHGNETVSLTKDMSLCRRMLYLHFNKTFSKEERIQALEKCFKDEFSGIFNMAIIGLHRLTKNNRFSVNNEITTLKERVCR